jgi:hypothetical protein
MAGGVAPFLLLMQVPVRAQGMLPRFNLNDLEKIHSRGSPDSYIMRFRNPMIHMGLKRDELNQSLRSDELLSQVRALPRCWR